MSAKVVPGSAEVVPAGTHVAVGGVFGLVTPDASADPLLDPTDPSDPEGGNDPIPFA